MTMKMVDKPDLSKQAKEYSSLASYPLLAAAFKGGKAKNHNYPSFPMILVLIWLTVKGAHRSDPTPELPRA